MQAYAYPYAGGRQVAQREGELHNLVDIGLGLVGPLGGEDTACSQMLDQLTRKALLHLGFGRPLRDAVVERLGE